MKISAPACVRLAVAIALWLVTGMIAGGSPDAAAQERSRQGQPPPDGRWAKIGEWESYRAALSVRHAASNGVGAPQIGLNPDWPRHDYAYWEKAQREYPKDAAKFEPCVAKFLEAIEIVKGIAPLTRRPAWDHSIDQINAALREAKAAIRAGDACLENPDDATPRRPLLKGRISHDEGTPPEAPADKTPPTSSTSSVPDMGALLRNLAGAIDHLAPHYDMTRPHEGLRVINDIVIGMGLGYLGKNLPGAVRAVLNKRGGERVYGGAGGLVPSSAGSWAEGGRMPAGLEIPGNVQAFPRPVFLQETPASCGAACARMVIKTVNGADVPEATLRNLLPRGAAPAEIRELQPLLRAGGVRTQHVTNATVDDIARATANGRPALVHVGSPGNGHYMVVDGIGYDASGRAFAFLRDPTNLHLAEASSRELLEAAGHTSKPIVTIDDLKTMVSGSALFVVR